MTHSISYQKPLLFRRGFCFLVNASRNQMYNAYIYFQRWHMIEKMVRTQVYLPQAVYAQLQKRAKKHGLTLAVQIRTALDDYLLEAEADKKPSPFDPGELFAIIDSLEGGGPGDLA